MMEAMRKLGEAALVEGLSDRMGDLEWGSKELSQEVNDYLLGLCGQAGAAILIRFSPLIDLGLDVADGPTAAAQLAALHGSTEESFADVVQRAWTEANDGKKPPTGAGYTDFRGEVVLETLRRLGGKKK
jgi:hypothetical protein